jgi:hypothetical protein
MDQKTKSRAKRPIIIILASAMLLAFFIGINPIDAHPVNAKQKCVDTCGPWKMITSSSSEEKLGQRIFCGRDKGGRYCIYQLKERTCVRGHMEKTCTHYIDACPNTRACEASPDYTYDKSCCYFAFCGPWHHAGFEKIYNH